MTSGAKSGSPHRQLAILAGGKGTRLQLYTADLPKPMVAIGGRPVLEYQIELAKRHGFEDIVLFTGHRSDAIEAHFGAGERFGVKIRYCVEEELLGTAGAVLRGLDLLGSRFMVMYGDTMLNVDLGRFWQTHETAGAEVSLFVHPNDHPYDSDLVKLDENGLVKRLHVYPHPDDACLPNLVNAALYVVERDALTPWRADTRKLDFAKHLFPTMLASGCKMYGYRSAEYIKDMGTKDRFEHVSHDLLSGKIACGSFATKQPAVFLDRDGTLNQEIDGVVGKDQLVLFPHVEDAIRQFNQAGLKTVLITNQPIIAKGMASPDDVYQVHCQLETMLGRGRAYLDRIYYCPHHPDRGFAGERPEYKIVCECRKPAIGMIQQAASEMNLDLSQSWLIGDRSIDVQTARNAGIRSILVSTGFAGQDGKCEAQPDYVFADLFAAAQFITQTGHKIAS